MKNCVTELFLFKETLNFSLQTPTLVWLQEGDTLSLDPNSSLGGPQPLGHWVDPPLQLGIYDVYMCTEIASWPHKD